MGTLYMYETKICGCRLQAATLLQLQRMWNDTVKENCLGASDLGPADGKIKLDGAPLGYHLSYNGRLWQRIKGQLVEVGP
jgi:hypothetical protein